MPEAQDKPILLLVDGHSLAFRSFYAFSKGGEGGLSTKDGIPTSVTYGFLKSLLDNCKILSPQGVTIAFDTAEPTFRHKADTNYKANRETAPEIFFDDLERLQKILKEHLNLPICIAPGFEADDVLGTLANKASEEGWIVRILSGDRDLFQLVNDQKNIGVLYMGGGPYSKNNGPLLIDEAGVNLKLGVSPEKVVDLKALTGDSSDNIPGVKGIGPKTAIKLLNENNDLDGIYNALEEIIGKGEKATKGSLKGTIKDKLKNDRDKAYLSRYLAEIIVNVPLPHIPPLSLNKVDRAGLKSTLEDLELNSLVSQVPSFTEIFSSPSLNSIQEKKGYQKQSSQDIHLKEDKKDTLDKSSNSPIIQPEVINNKTKLQVLVKQLLSCTNPLEPLAFDTETTDLNPFKAELVGLGFCWGNGNQQIAYIPIGHVSDDSKTNQEDLNQLTLEEALIAITPWLTSEIHPKTLQNSKFDRLILLRHGIELKGVVFDTLLADYLLDSSAKHSLETIAQRELNIYPQGFKEVVGKGKSFSNVSIEAASKYCGMDVYLTRKLALRLRGKLEKANPRLLTLLNEIEHPLEPVLATMEATGIRIDIPYLKKLSKEVTEILIQIENKVCKIAGIKFNLSSPKQLGEILFENLELDRKKSRRTKTGWSTDATVLERLEDDHPIIPAIIEHRILSKLRSTYIDVLPNLVEKETGRVHTDFNQAVTTTGRLSSSNPNLQNIPIRTEFSKRIRKAFLPQKGWRLISADYSQIELRILAHLSQEEILQEAYLKNQDVHTLTAKHLLEKETINQEERRLGKTINFGVIYGMGALRFARATGVSVTDAKEFLRRFKKRYPKVFTYLEMQERLALSKGYVETLFGRRRIFKFDRNGLGRLLGKNPMEIDLEIARRGGMEAQQLRAAANAPIQGSSADIIKIAMVKLHAALNSSGLEGRILLQVHDELVLEANSSDVNTIQKLVQNTMEKAVKLTVPLVVEIGIGSNWMEAK